MSSTCKLIGLLDFLVLSFLMEGLKENGRNFLVTFVLSIARFPKFFYTLLVSTCLYICDVMKQSRKNFFQNFGVDNE
jgi:hypothetical protein